MIETIVGIVLLNAGFLAIGGWAWLDERRFDQHVDSALNLLVD